MLFFINKKWTVLNNFLGIYKLHKTLLFDLLNKSYNYNFYNKYFINKIILTITLVSSLKSDTDVKIVNVLNILDMVLSKKTAINDFFNKYLYRNKSIIFVIKSTVNNFYDIYLIFFCLKKIIIPTLKRKFINIEYTILNNSFIFYIDDISSVAELADDLKKEKVSIKLSFFFNNDVEKKVIIFFLHYLGIYN